MGDGKYGPEGWTRHGGLNALIALRGITRAARRVRSRSAQRPRSGEPAARVELGVKLDHSPCIGLGQAEITQSAIDVNRVQPVLQIASQFLGNHGRLLRTYRSSVKLHAFLVPKTAFIIASATPCQSYRPRGLGVYARWRRANERGGPHALPLRAQL